MGIYIVKTTKHIKLKKSYRPLYFLVAIISSFSLSLSPMTKVFATSDWDNTIIPTSSLTISDPYFSYPSQDVTSTFLQYLEGTSCYSSLQNAINIGYAGGARWAITQVVNSYSGEHAIMINWVESHTDQHIIADRSDGVTPTFSFTGYGINGAEIEYNVSTHAGFSGYCGFPAGQVAGRWEVPSVHIDFFPYVSNFDVIYPPGYSLTTTMPGTVVDSDSDGLDALQEQIQGTSDSSEDSDGDGLGDFTESVWNTNRDSEFCDTSTPKNCAYPDPATKDMYLQVDWMNDGTNSFKPSATQLGMVSDAFATQGVKFHADTGLYGGGNQLSTYTSSLPFEKTAGTDYFDYKDSNLNSNRQGIWRYMISGNKYSEHETSSGASYAGSDNLFLSYNLVQTNQSSFGYSDADTAIAGSIIHELGHSLCLSSSASFSHQQSVCIYTGVDSDNTSYPHYLSSMNYSDQMAMVSYSTGANSPVFSDHDDWSAVKDQMGVYTLWDYDTDAYYQPGLSNHRQLVIGITTSLAKALKTKGLLKTGKATWRHLTVPPKARSHVVPQNTAPALEDLPLVAHG